ncbi:hypothetical protein C8R44DRAFT_747952 [Mycena epipterygia]|nr:hypothetical protein C8R44DRAFT_747952 [Mycena epipterygia]
MWIMASANVSAFGDGGAELALEEEDGREGSPDRGAYPEEGVEFYKEKQKRRGGDPARYVQRISISPADELAISPAIPVRYVNEEMVAKTRKVLKNMVPCTKIKLIERSTGHPGMPGMLQKVKSSHTLWISKSCGWTHPRNGHSVGSRAFKARQTAAALPRQTSPDPDGYPGLWRLMEV